jgi:hypothetical protein
VGEKRKTCRIFREKSGGRRPVGRPRNREEGILKCILKI